MLSFLYFRRIIFNVIFLSKILLFFGRLMQIRWAFDVLIKNRIINPFTFKWPIYLLSETMDLLLDWEGLLFIVVSNVIQVRIGLNFIAVFLPDGISFWIMWAFQHGITFYAQPLMIIIWTEICWYTSFHIIVIFSFRRSYIKCLPESIIDFF